MKQKASVCTMCILILDQIIKALITNNLELTDTVKVTDFFNLVFVRNYGAAWGILNGSRLLLIIVGIVTIFLLYTLFTNKPNENNFESIAIGFLTGGILGNLVDRIFRGYVVDYLSVKIVNYDFPVFNLADSCIVIGVIILILSMLGSEKYDNSRPKQHKA